MKKILNNLAHTGIVEETKEAQFITSTNWASIIAWAVTFPYIFIYHYLDVSSLVLVNLICLLLYPITIILNKYQKYKIAKIFFLFVGYGHVTAISVFYPPAGGYGLYFYLMPVISIFIFSIEEKTPMFIGVGLFFPFYFFTQYLYDILPQQVIEPSIADFFFHLAVSLILLFIIAFVYAFRVSSLFFQGKLHEQNKIIESQMKKVEIAHKNTRDSIEYAALIQNALIPENQIINSYCKEHFTFWQPKDTVGGDIYFITELKSKEEILVMVIDGAGHGVPGAFVTMLVKAIETQILADITSGILEPSPAKILEFFNKSIKTMLKQEKGSRSNAGFDGGVLYYNKQTNECIYAGAKTDLYIINNNKLNIIKSDRKNVGFVRTKIDQVYTNHQIDIKNDTKLYISTDGFYDQEGKENERYGKKEFERLLLKTSIKSMDKQKNEIINIFSEYKKNFEQSDDVTLIGLEF